jgi:hypothetical protein
MKDHSMMEISRKESGTSVSKEEEKKSGGNGANPFLSNLDEEYETAKK